jgi:hypothetical protein
MFRMRTFVLVLGVLVLLSPNLFAGTNQWAEGYPKRASNGDILVKGTATADSTFTLTTGTGTGTAVVWPAGRKGGNIITFTNAVDVNCDGTWSATLTGMGLDPKVRYVVVVQITETGSCCATNTIATPPNVTRGREDDQGDDD